MSKNSHRAHCFLGRSASYSTHGFGNGRVDVLPPHAIDPEFATLREQLQALRKQLKHAGSAEDRRALRERKRMLRAECRAAALTGKAGKE